MERRIKLQVTIHHLNNRVTIPALSYVSASKATSTGENLRQTNLIIRRVICIEI